MVLCVVFGSLVVVLLCVGVFGCAFATFVVAVVCMLVAGAVVGASLGVAVVLGAVCCMC